MQAFRLVFPFIVANVLACTAAAQTDADWPTFGGEPGGGQYSALDQINVSLANSYYLRKSPSFHRLVNSGSNGTIGAHA